MQSKYTAAVASVTAGLLAGVMMSAARGAPGAGAGAGRQGTAVLAARCVTCHNPEKKAGGIDLSTPAGAATAGAAGPDDPTKNRLVRAITAGKMPPTGKLPAGEIAALRQWVRAGAPYPDGALEAVKPEARPLWSLQPVKRQPVPRTPFDALARSPVDRFIFARLAGKGLRPSAPAPRLALLRRVTVDLTGLPPAPEEVAAFLADTSPAAYEKVVDRLLASPAYGERWGQHWLDVVRYGESHGYEQNHLRPNAWPYRDYVIRSFNEDKPYRQFIAEQLAGDLIGKGNPHVEAATGFLVAGVHDTVGNQTEEGRRQQRANDLDDIVSTTAETFLGLTAGCAKCHDHKFDPIPQTDYYRLAAVFSGVRHGERPLKPAETSGKEERETAEARRLLRGRQGQLMDLDTEARAALLRSQGVNPVLRPAVSARRTVDDFPPVTARFVRLTVTATRDGTEPCLDEVEVYAPDDEQNLALAAAGAKAAASSVLPGYAIHQVAHLNDGRYGNDWSWISSERGSGWAQIELPRPARISRVVWSRDSSDRPKFNDRLPSAYRLEVSEDGRTWSSVATSADRAEAPEAIPSENLKRVMGPEVRERRANLLREITELSERIASLATANTAYAGQFTAPDPIHVLIRGDVMQRGELVSPGALSRVPGLSPELPAAAGAAAPGEGERRLALAQWLADPANPLTARVMVNRVWQHHFGRGIVATPSDFGHNGEKPTHPELLDWLAAAFAAPAVGAPAKDTYACGWRLKRLHRLIVTSYTYRQGSATHPRGTAVDAGNQLLWHMPLRRMDAETVRDAVLFTSGKLNRQAGGPGFQLFKYRTVNVAIYESLEEHAPGTWRRSVYRQSARAIRDDLLGTLDCPDSSQRTPRRPSTTTALQALSLLNGTFMVQQAEFFAGRVRTEAGRQPRRAGASNGTDSLDSQVTRAFRLAFGRAPAAEELTAGRALAARQGLPALCRALLNANEFLYY